MNKGWIKLHRKLLDNPIYKKPAWLSVWITLLLLANHENEKGLIWNGRSIQQKKGQFITGRKKLREICGVPETTIERVLTYLESEHQIGQQKASKYRLITILKWDEYQNTDSKMDSKWTANGQQTDTIKNVRIKEDKNNTDTSDGVPSQDIKLFIDSFKDINPTHERLFGNNTERNSSKRLLKKYGLEKMLAMTKRLPNIISQPYAPKITTPWELEKNLGKLLIFVEQNKNINKIKKPIVHI